MKTTLYLLGLLAVFVLVAFLESPNVRDEQKSNYYIINDETKSVSASIEDPELPDYTQYVLEETKEEGDEIIEVYREYEIYEDDNGVVVKRIPTSNYDFLRYSKDEE